MLKFLILVLFIEQIYASKSMGARILNGTDAEEGEFPFAANLRIAGLNAHQCGASILNSKFILTAGHCVSCTERGTSLADPDQFNVQYGLLNITEDDTNSVNVSKIYCNNLTQTFEGPFFEASYDIAILKLATPLPDDGSWTPVTLARTLDLTTQRKGIVIGWGSIDEDSTPAPTLQKLTLDVYDDSVCGAVTNGDWDQHICVGVDGYGGPCYGDSGTAALIDGVQVGITSYTTTRPPSCGHGNATFPTVYTRVDKFHDWIVNITPDVRIN